METEALKTRREALQAALAKADDNIERQEEIASALQNKRPDLELAVSVATQRYAGAWYYGGATSDAAEREHRLMMNARYKLARCIAAFDKAMQKLQELRVVGDGIEDELTELMVQINTRCGEQ